MSNSLCAPSRRSLRTAGVALVLLAVMVSPVVGARNVVEAQTPEVRTTHLDSSYRASDSFHVAAGTRYKSGPFKRWVLGNNYRDLWATPIGVPVLNLHTYAGGIHPVKKGGGMQTKSLHFEAQDGSNYVFRMTDKMVTDIPQPLRHTPVTGFLQDQISALHPAGSQLATGIVEASGVLHPTPILVYMPDDPALGKFRQEFANKLGMIEEFPSVPDHGTGFKGAVKIIDSKDLLERMNKDGRERIDAPAYLTARLVDFLINDTDRHQGNWKWARMSTTSNAPWEPIARDRDHAFSAYDGWIVSLVRKIQPRIVSLEDAPSPEGISQSGSRALDARMLETLEHPAFDSVARALQARITDSVIISSVAAMPAEYKSNAPRTMAALMRRRGQLRQVAQEFFEMLSERVEVHGTDTTDRASIVRSSDSTVDVRIESAGKPHFARRFNTHETKELLVYLMNGDDTAVVSGNVGQSMKVRVVGGNGTNVLVDSSTVNGKRGDAKLYDNGVVHGESYGPDTLFDRRPYERVNGSIVPPLPDHGSQLEPIYDMSFHRRIGFAPKLGVARTVYGYAHRPYDYQLSATGEYGFTLGGIRVGMAADKRLESSPVHFTAEARVSDFEMVHYNGLGNNSPDSGSVSKYFDVQQRQYRVKPAVALAVGDRVDLSVGPVLQHSVTDSVPGSFLAATHPYGFGSFNQAGIEASATYDWRFFRNDEEHTHHRVMARVSAAYYPSLLDVTSAFSKVSAVAGTSITVPVPLEPFFVMRAGATKLFGTFPFYEAATIGGQGNTRYMDTQRLAGDAAMYASSELRVPLVHFNFVVPVRVGVLGLAEAGRVYVEGQSPGGWYSRTGEGFWIGRGHASPVATFTWTTEPGNAGVHVRLGLNF